MKRRLCLVGKRAVALDSALDSHLAPTITRAASAQTYWTIRLLADHSRVDDAYRAYAYFRWVDDTLDACPPWGSTWGDAERARCRRFLDRQKGVLERSLRGEAPSDGDPHEAMLVELVGRDRGCDARLESYLRNMMTVMEFDVGRRGRLVSASELDGYTRSLATAVTDALHHFIAHRSTAPDGETQYLAASGAHVAHMLRDTVADRLAGYINIPCEVLEANAIGPDDLGSDAYRGWVSERVGLARTCFAAGTEYLARVESARFRLAGLAYIARFEWLLDAIERDGYRLRPDYAEMPRLIGLRAGLDTAVRTVHPLRPRLAYSGPVWRRRSTR